MTRRPAALLALAIGITSLACGGLAPSTDFVVYTADAESIEGAPSAALAQGLAVAFQRCDIGGDLETERCRAIRDGARDALADDAVTQAEWDALRAQFPELEQTPEPGSSYDRFRERVDDVKQRRHNDFSRWPLPDELERRFEAVGWQDIDCDAYDTRGIPRHRCMAEIGTNTITARVMQYAHSRARRQDLDDYWYPGSLDARNDAVLNIRAYDEGQTRLLAKKMGLLEPDLDPDVSASWAKRMLKRGVEELYLCEAVDDGHECSGGTEDYRDIAELTVGQGEPDAQPETVWSGISLFRSWADGRYVELELVGTSLSEIRRDELLAVP
jgi:hypothetical protein